jgi:hypothetical protein
MMTSSRWESPSEISKYTDIGKSEAELRKLCDDDVIEHRTNTSGKLEIQFQHRKDDQGKMKKSLVPKTKTKNNPSQSPNDSAD